MSPTCQLPNAPYHPPPHHPKDLRQGGNHSVTNTPFYFHLYTK